VHIWYEGETVYEKEVVAAECDGSTVTVTTEDDELEFSPDSWDYMTVS